MNHLASRRELEQDLKELLEPRQLELFRETLELDFALDLPDIGRFRGNIARERGQVSISMRLIKVMDLDIKALGLPDSCRSLSDKQIGLVQVGVNNPAVHATSTLPW